MSIFKRLSESLNILFAYLAIRGTYKLLKVFKGC